MAPLINHAALLLGRVQRWWMDRTVNSLALGMVVIIFAAGLGNVPAHIQSAGTQAKSPQRIQVTAPARSEDTRLNSSHPSRSRMPSSA